MNIDDPAWRLKSPRCECCSGEGWLCFATCPNCGHVVLVCDEVGTVFPDPRDLENATYGGLEHPGCVCSKCGTIRVANFRDSTAEEIQALGYAPDEYQ